MVCPPAAVIYCPTDDVDALLARFVDRLRDQGVGVGGVLQHNRAIHDGCAEDMAFEDLMTGERFSLCQALGSGSNACRLDPDALARASVIARKAVEAGTDLVVFNKFGAREAGGEGLRDEMILAVMNGQRMLTAVGERFVEDWKQFTGDDTVLLPCEMDALEAWWSSQQQSD